MCGIEMRKTPAVPEILSLLETSQYGNGTRKKGEVRDPRISEDKDYARSSAMTYCTRALKGGVQVPGKNEDTEAERNKRKLWPLTEMSSAHWHNFI